MKKFISVFLCTVVFTVNVIFTPYVTTVYASGIVTDIAKSISFDNVVKMVKSLYKVGYNVATTGSGDGAASSKALDSIWGEDSAVNKWLQTKLFPFMDASRNIDLTNPDSPITYDKDKQLVEFNPTFTTELNQQLQDSVHALDGYYLFEPANSDLFASIPVVQSNFTELYKDKPTPYKFATSQSFATSLKEMYIDRGYGVVFVPPFSREEYAHIRTPVYIFKSHLGNASLRYIYIDGSTLSVYNTEKESSYDLTLRDFFIEPYYAKSFNESIAFSAASVLPFIKACMNSAYGSPFKIFYSLQDVKNYLNNGKQRTYVPKLPSGGLKVPITYIQNNVNLPDLNINLDSLIGKAELDIQADIDLALKNYFDSLLEINNNPTQPAKPTPTPDGGFTDGTTPTPTPPITDGGDDSGNDKTDFSKITDLLQKILDKLTEFSSNHDTLAKTIIGYIEKNDGKLDEIIVAINALADGKTEEEKNGCKYDFTALSDFMTTLWNESDKKFDKMVELLEENNKYQQKLVNSLNEIKALLVTQTIMDLFKDRSSETANKAKDKFPTSIPWDIALVLNSMSAEPEQLKFSLPIKIDSFKINETIDIDLSSDEWEKLATTCRYILSITFILFLIHLSRKLFSNGGDE